MYSTKAYSKMAAKTKTIHPNCQTSVAFKLIDLGAASLKNKITYLADKIDMVLPCYISLDNYEHYSVFIDDVNY